MWVSQEIVADYHGFCLVFFTCGCCDGQNWQRKRGIKFSDAQLTFRIIHGHHCGCYDGDTSQEGPETWQLAITSSRIRCFCMCCHCWGPYCCFCATKLYSLCLLWYLQYLRGCSGLECITINESPRRRPNKLNRALNFLWSNEPQLHNISWMPQRAFYAQELTLLFTFRTYSPAFWWLHVLF
jgi:hypothetical protein